MILAGLGTMAQTGSGISAARAQSRAAREEARSALLSSGAEAERIRSRTRFDLGKQRATIAASGLDPSSGSPLEFMLESARQGELEAQTVRYGGEFRRRSKLAEAKLARRQIPGLAFGGLARTGSIMGQWFAGA